MTLLREILKEATQHVDPDLAIKYWHKMGSPHDIVEIIKIFIDAGIEPRDVPDLIAATAEEIVRLPEIVELAKHSENTAAGGRGPTTQEAPKMLSFDEFSSNATSFLDKLSKQELVTLEKELLKRYPL